MDDPSDAPPIETSSDPRYGAFLIRVWANDTDGRVRLVVQQVGSTRQTVFADWSGIPRHVQECLARPETLEDDQRGEGDRADHLRDRF